MTHERQQQQVKLSRRDTRTRSSSDTGLRSGASVTCDRMGRNFSRRASAPPEMAACTAASIAARYRSRVGGVPLISGQHTSECDSSPRVQERPVTARGPVRPTRGGRPSLNAAPS